MSGVFAFPCLSPECKRPVLVDFRRGIEEAFKRVHCHHCKTGYSPDLVKRIMSKLTSKEISDIRDTLEARRTKPFKPFLTVQDLKMLAGMKIGIGIKLQEDL
jgi:hypothetical protein